MSLPQHIAAKAWDDGSAAKPLEDKHLAHHGVGQAGGKGQGGGGKKPCVHGAPIGGVLTRDHTRTAQGGCRTANSAVSMATPAKGAPMSSPHRTTAASLGRRADT